MADINRLIGFMSLMQVPFRNDHDALMYIEEVKNVLKAQEPMKPTYDIWGARCGNCGVQIDKYGGDHYCNNCGRKVKWDG